MKTFITPINSIVTTYKLDASVRLYLYIVLTLGKCRSKVGKESIMMWYGKI